MQTQLDLFEEYNELKAIIEHTNAIEKQVHNVRRGLFSRLGSCFKRLVAVDERLGHVGSRIDSLEKELKELRTWIAAMERVA